MNLMKLLTILFTVISFACLSQVYKYRAYGVIPPYEEEQIDCNILITINMSDIARLTIYSNETQTYDLISTIIENDEEKAIAIDQDGESCKVQLFNFANFTFFTIFYDEYSVSYACEKLE